MDINRVRIKVLVEIDTNESDSPHYTYSLEYKSNDGLWFFLTIHYTLLGMYRTVQARGLDWNRLPIKTVLITY